MDFASTLATGVGQLGLRRQEQCDNRARFVLCSSASHISRFIPFGLERTLSPSTGHCQALKPSAIAPLGRETNRANVALNHHLLVLLNSFGNRD